MWFVVRTVDFCTLHGFLQPFVGTERDGFERDFAYSFVIDGCDFLVALQINLEEVVAGKKYNVTIPGAQVVGAYGSYGNVLFVSAFVDWNAGAVQAFSDDITGVFENGVITLDAEEDYGVGEYIPGAGWLGAYLSYVDAEGNLVPVKFVKQ